MSGQERIEVRKESLDTSEKKIQLNVFYYDYHVINKKISAHYSCSQHLPY